MVEGEPDVNAIYRLTHKKVNQNEEIKWKNETLIINNKNICVFNTQNTFWVNPKIFFYLYSFVSFI